MLRRPFPLETRRSPRFQCLNVPIGTPHTLAFSRSDMPMLTLASARSTVPRGCIARIFHPGMTKPPPEMDGGFRKCPEWDSNPHCMWFEHIAYCLLGYRGI